MQGYEHEEGKRHKEKGRKGLGIKSRAVMGIKIAILVLLVSRAHRVFLSHTLTPYQL